MISRVVRALSVWTRVHTDSRHPPYTLAMVKGRDYGRPDAIVIWTPNQFVASSVDAAAREGSRSGQALPGCLLIHDLLQEFPWGGGGALIADLASLGLRHLPALVDFRARDRKTPLIVIVPDVAQARVLTASPVQPLQGVLVSSDPGVIEDLGRALHAALAGSGFVSPIAARSLLENTTRPSFRPWLDNVALLMAQQLSGPAIAASLGRSRSGVYQALAELRRHYHVDSNQELREVLARAFSASAELAGDRLPFVGTSS